MVRPTFLPALFCRCWINWNRATGSLGPSYHPYISLWVALDDVDAINGVVSVMPYPPVPEDEETGGGLSGGVGNRDGRGSLCSRRRMGRYRRWQRQWRPLIG
mmetsp:Transcript_36678/g.58911  ORF Transcript_36678/g.58911 Transcript_36678/m.58911 type:complete len:102 (-) Transcript_36678:65-370(-)